MKSATKTYRQTVTSNFKLSSIMTKRSKFKGESMFGLYKRIINDELENIQTFIEEISGYINEKQADIEKSYNNSVNDLQTESKDEFDTSFIYDDDIHKYHEIFPKHYFNPLLLSLFGLFENWLKRVCDLDSRRGFSNVQVKDLAGGNYIEKSRKYLTIVAELNLTESEQDWQKIKQIQKVRNAIAHNDSNIKTDKNREIEKQELYSFLKNDARIEFNENKGRFYIKDKEFLYEVIELIKKYLFFVISKLSSRKVIARNTTMPFNNVSWGHEKSENIIDGIISCIQLIEEFDKRTDEYRESDFKSNLIGKFESVLWDATKIYSFFCDSDWDVEDSAIIMEEKKQGFEKIKTLYNKKNSW